MQAKVTLVLYLWLKYTGIFRVQVKTQLTKGTTKTVMKYRGKKQPQHISHLINTSVIPVHIAENCFKEGGYG